MAYLYDFLIQVVATLISSLLIYFFKACYSLFIKINKQDKKIIILTIFLIVLLSIGYIFDIPRFSTEFNAIRDILSRICMFWVIYLVLLFIANFRNIINECIAN